MTTYADGLPWVYAARKRSMLEGRAAGAPGRVLRAFGASFWAGVPVEQLVALSANSTGPTEIVTDADFLAIGLYNTPSGPNTFGRGATITPAQVTISSSSSYGRLAGDPRVVAALGRVAVTNSPGWASDEPGQTAVGVLDYRASQSNVTSQLPTALRPRDTGGVWSVALAIGGYVNSVGMVRAINRHASELQRLEEGARFWTLCVRVAQEFQSGRRDAIEARALVRTWQRLACGLSLTSSPAWWHYDLSESVATPAGQWLAHVYYGSTNGSEPGPVPGTVSTARTVATGLAIVASGVALGAAAVAGVRAVSRSPKRRGRARGVLAWLSLLAVLEQGCQTQFLGSAYVDPSQCVMRCRTLGMRLTSVTYHGDFASSCTCSNQSGSGGVSVAETSAAPLAAVTSNRPLWQR